MPFTVLQHLVEQYNNSFSGSGIFSSLLLSSHCSPSDHICSTLYRFLGVLYLVTAITVGESFDASSIHPTDLLLLFPALYLFLGLSLSYSCLKMVNFHHPGFFCSMVFKSKTFVTSILVIDVTGKSHSFSFAMCNCLWLEITDESWSDAHCGILKVSLDMHCAMFTVQKQKSVFPVTFPAINTT